MKVYSQLESASLENLSSTPTNLPRGRVWWDTTESRMKVRRSADTVAVLCNDNKLVIGTSGTAASNIRAHRGAAAVLQFVLGSDTTTEGTLSTSLAQTSSRLENYTNAGKPSAANAGRMIWISDTARPSIDTGAAWDNILVESIATTKGDILARTSSALTRLGVGSDGFILTADSAQTTGLKWAAQGQLVVQSKTTTYTAVTTDDLILASTSGGGWTLSLFTAVGNTGKKIAIKKTDSSSNALTVDPNGSETMDGRTTIQLRKQYQTLVLVSDGTNWVIQSFDAVSEALRTTANLGSLPGTGVLYYSMGLSLALLEGDWVLTGYASWATTSNGIDRFGVRWAGADGANNSTPPTTISNVTILEGYEGALNSTNTHNALGYHSSATVSSYGMGIAPTLTVRVGSGGATIYLVASQESATGTGLSVYGVCSARRLR